MGLNLQYTDGQTPINDEEKEGLLIKTISTKGELDEFEQLNIEEALQWVFGRRFEAKDIFTERFICNLHKRMYANIWSWAGKYRKTEKNIGVHSHQIPIELKMLCDDAIYWIKHKTYLPEEIAIRFKHRIVSIHCFSNGNGRHSRLIADIIIEKIFGEEIFSWGTADISRSSDIRTKYLKAVKKADLGDFNPLIAFSRS